MAPALSKPESTKKEKRGKLSPTLTPNGEFMTDYFILFIWVSRQNPSLVNINFLCCGNLWESSVFLVFLFLAVGFVKLFVGFFFQMPDKVFCSAVSSYPWTLRLKLLLHWRFGALTMLVFLGMAAVWTIDGCNVKSFVEGWRFRREYLTHGYLNLTYTDESITLNLSYIPIRNPSSELDFQLPFPANLTNAELKLEPEIETKREPETEPEPETELQPADVLGSSESYQNLTQPSWISVELEPNLTSNLLARWLAPGGEPCREIRSVEIAIPGLDGRQLIELPAGETHEFVFNALYDAGKPSCLGGDYFETDLSGETWKSRPVVKDFGNGSYSLSLQVHPDFSGDYNLSITLLYRHFEGLKLSPARFAYNKELRRIPIKFYNATSQLPQLQTCRKSDFSRELWAGRWTRHGRNDDCQISNDGRYRCLPPNFPCRNPWCDGALGMLESNGWVYSAHCSFRLFSADSAWNCLKNRWIFFWGDSNHVDTVRNILNFILNLPTESVPRRFDMNFTNPKNPTQTVRITSIFNGHWNETLNYQGLNSLKNDAFRDLLKSYFNESTVPDTIIMNSGLHDGIYWHNLRGFTVGARDAAAFWAEIMESIRRRGLTPPEVIYRTTVATGGYARTMAFNPSKMEAFNWVVLDKLKTAGLLSGVIDDFDMTFPWHFDNRCSDGVHYGRKPAKMKWRDGLIGHQYFVDIMLAHVLLNALCAH